jgi:hypothetical protein
LINLKPRAGGTSDFSSLTTKQKPKGRRKKEMEDLLMQVANFGFPMVLAMYLLIRIEGKLEALTTSLTKLTLFLQEHERK